MLAHGNSVESGCKLSLGGSIEIDGMGGTNGMEETDGMEETNGIEETNGMEETDEIEETNGISVKELVEEGKTGTSSELGVLSCNKSSVEVAGDKMGKSSKLSILSKMSMKAFSSEGEHSVASALCCFMDASAFCAVCTTAMCFKWDSIAALSKATCFSCASSSGSDS